MHCAVCNDDADDVMEWSASVIIKKIIPFFSNSSLNGAFPDTFEKLFPFLNSARYSDIIYTPPVAVEDSSCLIRDLLRLKHCEQSTEEALSTFDRLFDSCRQFYNPVRSSSQNFYKNIFCFVCLNTLQLTSNNPSCSQREAVRAQSGYLTALFNYKSESAKPESHEEDLLVADGPCGCAEIFDPYLVNTRTLTFTLNSITLRIY